jgi:dipeptidyl aminopeptidase/acylaminoacyl peptidase
MCFTLPLLQRRRDNLRLIFLFYSVVAVLPAQPRCQQKPFTVKEDIAMVRFNDPSAAINASEQDSELYSPDKNHVAVLTSKELLASDQEQSSIAVFDLSNVHRFLQSSSYPPPRPRIVATIKCVPKGEQAVEYAPLIKDIRWAQDSEYLYFRAQDEQGGYQLYEANMNGSGFRSLTSPSYDVDRFDLAGDTIVYTAAPMGAHRPSPGSPINRDALDVTGYFIKDILFPGQMTSFEPQTFSMFTLRLRGQRGAPRQVPGYSVRDTSLYLYTLPFRLSPDTRRLVSAEPVTGKIPDSWERYDPVPLFEHRRLRSTDPDLTRPDSFVRPRLYISIDIKTGRKTPLLGAPIAQMLGYFADVNRVAWSTDETRILVTNSFFQPDARPGEDISIPTKPCAVASIDLSSLHRRCLYFDSDGIPLGSEHIADVRFGPSRNEAFVYLKQADQRQRLLTFHLQGDVWKLDAPASSDDAQEDTPVDAAKNIKIYVKQSLNEIPALWVSDTRTKQARLMWNPNPQFQNTEFAPASVHRWKDPTGRQWIGGLLKPIGYIPGHRYPLVIQMYMFREHTFLSDGTDPSAFAARHLASVGFVVLQIQKQPNVFSDADAQTALAGYESAVQSLSDDGLIDPKKVGVVGFSWTCWYVVNALVKAPHLFAVATIADGLDNSYMQYMLFGPGSPNLQDQMGQIRGGRPFGTGLNRWINEAPGFHLDRVLTPVRIEAPSPASVLQEWELYASLRMQHKPVDMIYFPNGTHIHRAPMERLESQQGDVDWMRFWLQDYEDPDPSKQAQYERWRKLRADFNGALSNISRN